MQLGTTVLNQTATLRLQGRFDFAAHRDFRTAFKAALERNDVREIILDFGSVDYIDSSALGMLLLSLENAKAVGKTIALARVAGTVKQVLDIANFQRLFTIK
jgi:anti-anti-sigma factor